MYIRYIINEQIMINLTLTQQILYFKLQGVGTAGEGIGEDYQTVHFSFGFMADPMGQSNTREKSLLLDSVPITL